MSCELVGTVTATPGGPLMAAVGQSVAITGSYTLNGPGSGGVGCTYALNWEHISPGAPTGFGNQDPAVDATPYVRNWTAALPLGAHIVRVSAIHTDPNVPGVFITSSNEITITVVGWTEETDAATPTWIETSEGAATWTEQEESASAWTELEETPPTWTEQFDTAPTWTEEQ